MAKLKLKDLLQKIDWVMIEKDVHFNLSSEKIYVSFQQRDRANPEVDQVRIKLGQEVMNQLKWKVGDKIDIFHHPDDLMSFMLVKGSKEQGFTIVQEQRSPFGTLTFRWKRPIKLTKMKNQEVQYLTPKDQYIVFRVDDNTDD